jgi:serine/threonine-protein kinase
MAGGDEDTASGATLADHPRSKRAVESAVIASATERPATHPTSPTAPTGATGELPRPQLQPTIPSHDPKAAEEPIAATAADALHAEEIDRTRLFIRMGWLISLATIASVPLLHAPRAMSALFIAAMVTGIVVSSWFHRAFADPTRYTARALLILAEMCLVNAHVAVLYYGAFTITPLIVVIGIHFVARTEAERAARWIIATALSLYAAIATAIITHTIPDPGVFASDRPISTLPLVAGAIFVLGTYVLAYVTARSFRRASIRAIDSLARTTRLASQREALMDELRLDLERALRVGGPGRYTDHIVGSYRLGAVIGRGAMGEVYDASHVVTGEPAAVKLVRRDLLAEPVHVARFLREVRASGALDSPHVARLLDASDRDPPYLAMERLHGETLAERLRRDGKLAGDALAALVREVGQGLDAASTAGVVHRDIKPQNLFHDRNGAWKILDFGVATLASLADDTGTLTHGEIIGTPSYMAPEQAQGKRLDGRADLHALAAVAYRCATGRHPFSGTDTPALLYAVVHRMPPRPGDAAELPADVDRWFALALAKAPADRFATGAAMADALDAALAAALDAGLRKRADALIKAAPWG